MDAFAELMPIFRARKCQIYSDHANAVRYMTRQSNYRSSKYAALYHTLIHNLPATWNVHKVPAHATADKLYHHAHLPIQAFIGNAVADAMAKAAAAQAYSEENADMINRERDKWRALTDRAIAVYTRWREGPAQDIPEAPKPDPPPRPPASAYDRALRGTEHRVRMIQGRVMCTACLAVAIRRKTIAFLKTPCPGAAHTIHVTHRIYIDATTCRCTRCHADITALRSLLARCKGGEA